MAEWKDVRASPPARTPELQLTPEQPSAGGRWIPPHVQRQRRRPDKTQEGKIVFRNLIPARDAQRAQIK